MFVGVDHPTDKGFTDDDYQGSCPYPTECQSGNPGGPAPNLTEDNGIGDKAKVENAVNDGYVQIPEDANGFCDGHDEGSRKVDFKELEKRDFLIVAAPPAGIAGFFAAESGFAFEDGRGICFFDDADENPGDAGDDHYYPVRPAPTKVLRRETTDDRAELRKIN